MMPRRTICHAPIALALLIGGCATEAPPVVKAPPPPLPVVAPPAPGPVDWRDMPMSPGIWTYATDAQGSSASFGARGAAPEFILRCMATSRQVTLTRTGATAPLTVTTSYGARTLPATAGVASLAATDPLLDQIAFSRARFSIESAGTMLLMMPAWAEPARVIEDCRAPLR